MFQKHRADVSGCIYRTTLGGLNRGYEVTFIENGLFATSQQSKAKMLALYQKQGIQITSTPFQ